MDKKPKKYLNIISCQTKKIKNQEAKFLSFLMINLRISKCFRDKTDKHKRQVLQKRDQILKKIITYWWDKCKLHKFI